VPFDKQWAASCQKKEKEASLAHAESIPFYAGRKITIYFPYS